MLQLFPYNNHPWRYISAAEIPIDPTLLDCDPVYGPIDVKEPATGRTATIKVERDTAQPSPPDYLEPDYNGNSGEGLTSNIQPSRTWQTSDLKLALRYLGEQHASCLYIFIR
jgi:hypothetical protein